MAVPATTTAGWIASIAAAAAAFGTVGTLIVVLAQLTRERAARAQLESESRAAKKREQAERISGWLGEQFLGMAKPEASQQRIELLNASHEPVYRVVVYLVFIQGAGPRTGPDVEKAGNHGSRRSLSVLPPGRHHTSVKRAPSVMFRRHGVELAFTDKAGVHWLRSADGALTNIDQPPSDYYGLSAPINWETPEA